MAYALIYPGVNALRTPFYPEMINVVENRPVTFEGFKFDEIMPKQTFINSIKPLMKTLHLQPVTIPLGLADEISQEISIDFEIPDSIFTVSHEKTKIYSLFNITSKNRRIS